MAPSKPKKEEAVAPPEEIELEAEVDVEAVEEVAVDPVVGVPASAPGGPVPGRKSLGVKEPIVFMWKVVGRSANMTVTLFKSVEREESEAQLERLTRDGYYSHLQLLEATAKVEQPPQPKESKDSKKAKAKEKEVAAKVAAAKAAADRPAPKSTPIRIPGKPVEPKKTRGSKSADKSKDAKSAKGKKSKSPTKSKKTKKK